MLNSDGFLLIAVTVESDGRVLRPLLNVYDGGFVFEAARAHSEAFSLVNLRISITLFEHGDLYSII